jgi:hypothetical protein
MITAHGTQYPTPAAAEARIAELNEVNAKLGASDGRVTEILCIMDALHAAGFEQTPAEAARPARAAAPALSPAMAQHVMEAERDLASIRRSGYDDGRWRYLKTQDEAGRIKVRREYRTQAGFLTAFIREARRGHDILIAE